MSPTVMTYSSDASVSSATVLYSETPRYYDAGLFQAYKFVMYQVFQPSACDGVIAGYLYVSFSDDGICWTAPRPATRSGGITHRCNPNLKNLIPVEQVTAIDGGAGQVYLIGVEGNRAELAPSLWIDDDNDPATPEVPDYTYKRYQNMGRTLTFVGWVNPSNPRVVNLFAPSELTKTGMFIPDVGPWNAAFRERYFPYSYFMNLQAAYDASSGDLYIGRAYPYPFDRGSGAIAYGWPDSPSYSNVPRLSQSQEVFLTGPRGNSQVQGCEEAPAVLPNRVQIYKMHVGSLTNIAQITSGAWTLVMDAGGPFGYGFRRWIGGPTATPLVTGQTNVGRDFGSVSFLRDQSGALVRNGGVANYFGGDTYMLSKGGNEPCRITGLERNTVMTLP